MKERNGTYLDFELLIDTEAATAAATTTTITVITTATTI